jgi:hypothetical protein
VVEKKIEFSRGGLYACEKQDKDYQEKYNELRRERREEISPLQATNLEEYLKRNENWNRRLEELCKE